MPWTAADVDKHKKGLTPSQKTQWAKIANGALKSCQAKKGSDCEGRAIRIANSKFAVVEEGCPWTLADMDDHDEHFGLAKADATEKPGGSNVGKYKKGPFCGPAGGAPKGSYPVNTRKRAKAALAYARNAPNPQGIKNCVYRHWPDLKPKSKSKQSDETEAFSMSKQEVPKGALRLVEEGTAHCEFAEAEDGKKIAKLDMLAYSGKPIKNHFYWGDLVIDLQGMKFEGKKFPILENHDTGRKIAFTGKPIINDKFELRIDPETTTFVDTDASAEFQKLSSEGFPYQASIYAKPSKIERIDEGSQADVNGFTQKGPAVIWRECSFKESSVCVFGWDTKTSSSAFSRETMEEIEADVELLSDQECTADSCNINPNTLEKGGNIVDLEQFKNEHSDIADQFKQEIVAELNKTFEGKEQAHAAEIASFSEKIAGLERKDAIRTQQDIARQAGAIIDTKLSASDVAETLFSKVKSQISHSQFVENDVLDVEKFGVAVDTEIQSWVDAGATKKVLGAGFSKKTETGEADTTQFAEENKNLTASLLALAGQVKEQ